MASARSLHTFNRGKQVNWSLHAGLSICRKPQKCRLWTSYAVQKLSQQEKGTAGPTAQYRPQGGELHVIFPELTLLHCLSTLPDPWPLAKITIDWRNQASGFPNAGSTLLTNIRRTVGIPSVTQVPDIETAL